MTGKIYLNLPVKNLGLSIRFFSAPGFCFNAEFTDETASCMIVSEAINVMLLTHEKFSVFSPNPVCNVRQHTEVLICLTSDSRAAVNELVELAVNAGGNTYKAPQDHGFMYGHGFQDLNGHVRERLWINPDKEQQHDNDTV
jgi:predicted lactoylglutathione lyase